MFWVFGDSFPLLSVSNINILLGILWPGFLTHLSIFWYWWEFHLYQKLRLEIQMDFFEFGWLLSYECPTFEKSGWLLLHCSLYFIFVPCVDDRKVEMANNNNNNKEPSNAPHAERWYDLTLGSSFKDNSSSKFFTLRCECHVLPIIHFIFLCLTANFLFFFLSWSSN